MKLDKLPNHKGMSDFNPNLFILKQILFVFCVFSSLYLKSLRMSKAAETLSHSLCLSVEDTYFSYTLYTFKLYLLEKRIDAAFPVKFHFHFCPG